VAQPEGQLLKFIGLDLAWSGRNASGIAVLEGNAAGARLTHSGLLGSDAEVLAFLDEQAAGSAIIAIDAPLSVPNETGKRPGETLLAPVFGRQQANAHPANRATLTRYNGGEIRGEVLKAALQTRGFVDDPFWLVASDVRSPDVRVPDIWVPGIRVMVEVYPHAAMVALFGLSRTLKYKQKGQGRDKLDAAWREYHAHLAALALAEPPMTGLDALLSVDPSTLRGATLKNHEDEVDAVMCAYIALYAHRFPGRCEVFGTVAEGYILTPTLPERWRDGPV
jgi:predicted RNase H-like nuclease